MTWVELWFRAFLVTLAAEACVVIPLLGRKHSYARRLGALLVVNLATHPIVWFVIPPLSRGRFDWTETVVISEAWAIGLELFAYRLIFWSQLPWKRCAWIALAANLASTIIGLALRALGVPV